MLLADILAFPVDFVNQVSKVLFFLLLLLQLRLLAQLFFRCIADKGIKNIANRAVGKMPVIFYPQDFPVFSFQAVFHVVKVIPAFRNLLADAFFHFIQVFVVDKAFKGISGKFAELA